MTTEKSEASIRELYEKVTLLLHYDKETGSFTRKIKRRNAPENSEAGSLKKSGYVEISFDGTTYRRSRLAFFFVNGFFPKGEIDHINGIRNDDRWENLRCITRGQNKQNQRKPHSNNRSGFLGVSKRTNGLFVAQIKLNGKVRHLGVFKTSAEAYEKYVEAKRKLHEFNTL